MLFKDKNLPFGAPQMLEFQNYPYVFQWGETGWDKLKVRREVKNLTLFYKIYNN
jgi:hypothetical protein